MNNFELIKGMTVEELAVLLYVNISREGLKKTEEWLKEDIKEERRLILTPKEITINYLKSVSRDLEEQFYRQWYGDCDSNIVKKQVRDISHINNSIILVEESEGE